MLANKKYENLWEEIMKKMNLRKVVAFMMSLCMLIGVLTGCGGPKVDAAGSCKAIYALYILQDSKGVLDMGMEQSDADTALKAYDDTMASSIKNLFVSNGLTVDDETVNEIVAAREEALSRLTCTTEITSSDKKTATVLLKTNYIDETGIATKASEDAIAQLEKEKETDTNKRIELISGFFAQNLIDGYKNSTPVDDQKELTIECSVTGNIWMPDNMTNFGTKLGQAVSGQ